MKTREAIDLIGDVTKLSAEELAALKAGYLSAIGEMETVAAHGKALGITENEIRAFMNLLGIDLRLRDSSYSGMYYCAGSGVAKDFVIEMNDEKSRWHSQYSQYGAVLMVQHGRHPRQADLQAHGSRLSSVHHPHQGAARGIPPGRGVLIQ